MSSLKFLPSSQNPLLYWGGAFDFSLLANKDMHQSGKFKRFVFVNDLGDLTEEEIYETVFESVPEEAGLFIQVPVDYTPNVIKLIFQSGYEVDFYFHTSLSAFIREYRNVVGRIRTVYVGKEDPFLDALRTRHLHSIDWILGRNMTILDRRYMRDPKQFPKEERMDPIPVAEF
jgi:hypothetical protein